MATPFTQVTLKDEDGWRRGRIRRKIHIYVWPLKQWIDLEDRIAEAFGE